MIQEKKDKDLRERVELGMEKRGQERKSLAIKMIRTLAGWTWSSTERLRSGSAAWLDD